MRNRYKHPYLCVYLYVHLKESMWTMYFLLYNIGAFFYEDTTKFVLVEVHSNAAAPAAHKGTAHYAR